MDRVGIGIVGCGNISEAYLKAASHFPILDIRGVADLQREAAEARASQFGLQARSVEELLDDPSVEIIVNLTIPAAHVDVGLQALEAGQARPFGEAARDHDRRRPAAPRRGETGAASASVARPTPSSAARTRPAASSSTRARSAGRSRAARSSCAPATSAGIRTLPSTTPQGGGPMLDMGPYYITALVNLIGPVARVSGIATRARRERMITSEPLEGHPIDVEVATHVAGTFEFVSGAVVSIAMSFDVPKHRHGPIELYGTEATLIVPDPNRFGGKIEIARAGQDWSERPTEHAYADGNYRIIGVADLAHAIRSGRPHRASGELALHVLEVMEAFQASSDRGDARDDRDASGASRRCCRPDLRLGELD